MKLGRCALCQVEWMPRGSDWASALLRTPSTPTSSTTFGSTCPLFPFDQGILLLISIFGLHAKRHRARCSSTGQGMAINALWMPGDLVHHTFHFPPRATAAASGAGPLTFSSGCCMRPHRAPSMHAAAAAAGGRVNPPWLPASPRVAWRACPIAPITGLPLSFGCRGKRPAPHACLQPPPPQPPHRRAGYCGSRLQQQHTEAGRRSCCNHSHLH